MHFSSTRAGAWIIVFVLIIFEVRFALMLESWPPARDFLTEFSVALGYAVLAMMTRQFGLTARLRHVTKPWRDDIMFLHWCL